MARKKVAHSGGHGWFVTFADLMALMMSFFVMLVAFSSPNQKKQQIVAGSMREAFGVQKNSRASAIIETDGLATRTQLRNVAKVTPDYAADQTTPFKNIQRDTSGTGTFMSDRGFTTAAASLRQALQELPELTEASRNVIVEEIKEGLHIQITDQEGRSMFAEGSAWPYERMRKVISGLAPTLRRMPNRLRVTGHTGSGQGEGRDRSEFWRLSTERALGVRDILSNNGIADDRFESVVGKADTEPLFPDDPFIAPNRRISILVVREAPPLPP
ncbi:MotB Flagellar motor protein [Rhabdaerophilaceae bacterium]